MERAEEMLDDTRRGWKTQAKNRCRVIIDGTLDGQLVVGEDAEFLQWLLDKHPQAPEKIGRGVAGFSVQTTAIGTRCFFVHRVDGSSTDFSYYSCTTAPDSTALIRKAMRRAVADQIIGFKQASAERGPLICAVTGDALSWDDAHVDHAPPIFVALADEWASRQGGYSAIRLPPAMDKQIGRSLIQPDAESWALFHQEHAQLRIVSKLANLSLLRRSQ
jgi:Protein of unknown function (DUF3223)